MSWIDSDGAVEVTRLNGAGGIDVPATAVSAGGDVASAFVVSASAGGGAVAWTVPDPDSGTTPVRIAGVRLPATGALVGGAPFSASGAAAPSRSGGPRPVASSGWPRW